MPGLGIGDDFVSAVGSISSDSSVVMLAILLVFAVAHSGLAFLRPYGETPLLVPRPRAASLPVLEVACFADRCAGHFGCWEALGGPLAAKHGMEQQSRSAS
jgi:hypothetical protein